MRLDELDKKITQSDLDALEIFADRIFGKVGIDVEFTRHFLDRVNDARNGEQITGSELTRLFKQEYKRWGKPIAQMGPDAEAVMKDLQTDINMPFALRWDRDNNELDLIVKTVMRKKDFKTSNKEFPVESIEEDREESPSATEMKISDLTISDAGMAIAQSVGGGSRTDAPLAVTKLPSGHVYLVNGYHRLVDAMQAGKDTVSVKYVPYEKVEILWKQEREQDIKYGKQFNEESEIWQWNKEDPNNPEVHIQGYGRLMLNQIEDSIVGKLKELTKMAERGDFEQIQSLLDRDVMQSMMKAVVDTKAELQATRKRGGPKSRGINRESILDVIGKSEIKELDLKEFTLNRETSVKEEEKKNDLLKGFDPRTERALMMLKAKYPQADNILSALLADVENNEEDSDVADLSHELKMDKLLKAVEVLQKEINLLKGGKKLNVVKETGGVGKIVPGINTTVDVGPNEITKQAAKFGNKVSKDGLPKKTFRRK